MARILVHVCLAILAFLIMFVGLQYGAGSAALVTVGAAWGLSFAIVLGAQWSKADG